MNPYLRPCNPYNPLHPKINKCNPHNFPTNITDKICSPLFKECEKRKCIIPIIKERCNVKPYYY